MRSFRCLTTTFLAVWAVWMVAPLGTAQGAEKKLVRFNEVVRVLAYAPQYVALSQDFFGDEGLKIRLRIAWGGDKSMTGLLTKRDDISLLGPEVTYYAIAQGVPDPVISFAQLTNRDTTFLMSRTGAPKFTWEGLRGKTVLTVRPASTPHMVAVWALAKRGLINGKDVTVQPLTPPTMVPAFLKGRGDYAFVWEPLVSKIEKAGQGVTVASLGLEGGELAYTNYAALASYIKENSGVVQRFTNAIYKGMQWIDTHSSSEVAEAVKTHFKQVPVDILASALERMRKQTTWRSDPIISDAATYALQDILIFNKALKKRLPAEKVNIHGFGEKAVKMAKRK